MTIDRPQSLDRRPQDLTLDDLVGAEAVPGPVAEPHSLQATRDSVSNTSTGAARSSTAQGRGGGSLPSHCLAGVSLPSAREGASRAGSPSQGDGGVGTAADVNDGLSQGKLGRLAARLEGLGVTAEVPRGGEETAVITEWALNQLAERFAAAIPEQVSYHQPGC